MPETNMPTAFHIHTIYGITVKRHTWEMCVYFCTIFEVTDIIHVTRSTVHILCKYMSCYWHISLKRYGHHITNICHTALILYRQIDVTMVHICASIQATIYTWHVTLIYVPETNMPNKLHIYVTYLKGIYVSCLCIYMC